MGADDLVRWTVDSDGVAWMTLDRPDKLNALNQAMRGRIAELAAEANRREDIRVVVFSGEGRAFCVGQDLTERAVPNAESGHQEPDFLDAVWRLQKPTLAALHGYVLGRGLLLALACDIRIAAEDAALGLPEVQLGMLPGGGGTQRLPRLIGMGRAMELVLTGDRIGADTACAWGVVNRVVPPDRLSDEVGRLARRIAANAPLAVQNAKAAIRMALDVPLAYGIVMEQSLQRVLRNTLDWKEGTSAFRERRPPRFQGR
jgi:enoyl-CoA hydratase/carnithine racemase